MTIARGFVECEWLVLTNETRKLESASDRNIKLLIQYGLSEYRKIKSDRRRKNPRKKENALDIVFETIEALNNEQIRRLNSEQAHKISQALKAGTLFRKAEMDTKVVSFPNPQESPTA